MRSQKGIFPFKGKNKESYCGVTIYRTSEPIVIISELEANQGASPFNYIDKVTKGIVEKYELDPKITTFVSPCSNDQKAFHSSNFYLVPVKWNGQSYEITKASAWDIVSSKEVESMIGSHF